MGSGHQVATARDEGFVGCRTCGRVSPMGTPRCPRCNARLQSRDEHALQKVWAWSFAGLVAYIPANLYPMLLTTTAFRTSESTIVGGVVELIEHHAYAVAFIVFFASVVIPLSKFFAIWYLAWILRKPHERDTHRLHFVYEIVEFVGRWSMVDVFVVAILSSLVQFSLIATVKPGPAAFAFALSVIFTMLSAQSFDSRLIWDQDQS